MTIICVFKCEKTKPISKSNLSRKDKVKVRIPSPQQVQDKLMSFPLSSSEQNRRTQDSLLSSINLALPTGKKRKII